MGGSVTLKLATSLDGRIATASGESRWITGPQAREAVHRLRAGHDAVLVGVETALADDPDLTVRLDGWSGPQPARVVLDSRQRLAADCRLVRTAREIPTYVIATEPPQYRLVEAGEPGPQHGDACAAAVVSTHGALPYERQVNEERP